MHDTLPLHPDTGLRAIGHTRRGPIWPVLGGDGTGDGNTGDDSGTGDNNAQSGAQGSDASNGQASGKTGGQQQTAAPTGQQGTGDNTGQQDSDTDDLANLSQADLARMVKDLRKENGSARTNAKQTAADEAKQDMAQQIGKALGLVNDDDNKAPDPEQLTQQLTAEQERARSAIVKAAIYEHAGTHGADPKSLDDSRSFREQLEKLDPSDDKFAEHVDKAIKQATENNPRLRASGQAPPRSSGQHAGGTGGNKRPGSLSEALANRYNT